MNNSHVSDTSSAKQAPSTSKEKQTCNGENQKKKQSKKVPKKPPVKKTNRKQSNVKPSRKKKKYAKPEFVWKRFPENPRKVKLSTFTMNENRGPNVLDVVQTHIDFFSLFLSDELLDTIVVETNRYSNQTKGNSSGNYYETFETEQMDRRCEKRNKSIFCYTILDEP